MAPGFTMPGARVRVRDPSRPADLPARGNVRSCGDAVHAPCFDLQFVWRGPRRSAGWRPRAGCASARHGPDVRHCDQREAAHYPLPLEFKFFVNGEEVHQFTAQDVDKIYDITTYLKRGPNHCKLARVEQVEVVAAHGEVDGVLDAGDLVAEKKYGGSTKVPLLPVNPDRPGFRVQDVQGIVIQDERCGALQLVLGGGGKGKTCGTFPGCNRGGCPVVSMPRRLPRPR